MTYISIHTRSIGRSGAPGPTALIDDMTILRFTTHIEAKVEQKGSIFISSVAFFLISSLHRHRTAPLVPHASSFTSGLEDEVAD